MKIWLTFFKQFLNILDICLLICLLAHSLFNSRLICSESKITLEIKFILYCFFRLLKIASSEPAPDILTSSSWLHVADLSSSAAGTDYKVIPVHGYLHWQRAGKSTLRLYTRVTLIVQLVYYFRYVKAMQIDDLWLLNTKWFEPTTAAHVYMKDII